MSFHNEIIGMPDEVDESYFLMYNEMNFRKIRLFKSLVAFNNDNIRTIAYRNNLDPTKLMRMINGKTYMGNMDKTYTKIIYDYVSNNIKELMKASDREKKVSKLKSYISRIKKRIEIYYYKYFTDFR